jgi:hypothetical protein
MSTLGARGHGVLAVALLVGLWLTATGLDPVAGAALNRPYYSVARNLWLSEADMVSGALQNVPLVAAAHDLERGKSVKGADVDGYAKAISTINAFERIPLTSETPSQMRASHREWAALNTFFGISPEAKTILDDDVPSGGPYRAAEGAWQHEPSGTRRGFSAATMDRVVADLREARAAEPRRAIIFQAALVDARSLARASARDIAATTSASLLDPYTQDIYYLNVFMRADRLQVSASP